MKNLKRLNLYGNKIQNISELSGLVGLIELSLFHNAIDDLSGLKDLANLNMLDLFSNKIESIDKLRGLVGLTELSLGNSNFGNKNCISGFHPLAKLKNL